MMYRVFILFMWLVSGLTVHAQSLLNIETTFEWSKPTSKPRVILTLDACGGAFDEKLAQYLVREQIPATLFVTSKFIRRNPKAVVFLKQHLDLFDIQNHGGEHFAAVSRHGTVYGVHTTGSIEQTINEVQSGYRAIEQSFGVQPTLYRGATALYDRQALEALAISNTPLVGGYSVSWDDGASLSSAGIIAKANRLKNGDVLLAHINHPERGNGEHLILGLDALRSQFEVVSWRQALELGRIRQKEIKMRVAF